MGSIGADKGNTQSFQTITIAEAMGRKAPLTVTEARKIADKATFTKTSPADAYGIWEAQTPLGKATIRENKDYIEGRSTWKYSAEAYGLKRGTGNPEYFKTLAQAKKRARQLLVDKSV